ncbi:uncharacterized protein LOC130647098 [Hydractinia symbiolongicarpus]|uniref:uncharacterized protein LOC130647098 n=1 Tax=Hydractinia symbiolongicarpus TaxID=13093 RepID=UPI00254BD34A|nr:uncharacterized protein LOC130647098 [Hydractinia symbiolongicarpus]
MSLNVANSDVQLMETYQHRIAQIQNVSDVIAVANLQLNKALQKFGWSRQKFLKDNCLLTCNIDKHHEVKRENLSKHLKICNARKQGMKDIQEKDFVASPSSCYPPDSSVVPVFVSETQFSHIGVHKSLSSGECNDATGIKLHSLRENNEDINQYKPCDSLDELRFIYSWRLVPTQYYILDAHELPINTLKDWLVENITKLPAPAPQYAVEVANSVVMWMNTLQNVDDIVNRLKGIFGAEASTLVLNLWKFIAAKKLCTKQNIPEQTRHEFDFYASALIAGNKKTETSKDSSDQKRAQIDSVEYPFLPMDWVSYNLSREQKLKIYEEVHQTGKLLATPVVEFNELAAEAEEQMKVLASLNSSKKGEKTHLEVMAELRDYKRRRQSYRGKNKMNRKMTGLEVLKEVVDQQMLYLQILQGKNVTEKLSEDISEKDVTLNNDVPDDSQGTESPKSKEKNDESESRSRRRSLKDRDRWRSRSRDRKGSEAYRSRHDSKNRTRHRSRSRSRDRRRSKERHRKDRRDGLKDKQRPQPKNVVSNITYY